MAFTDTAETVLDTIFYYIHSESQIRDQLVESVLTCIDDHLKETAATDVIMATYRDILRSMVQGKIDKSKPNEIALLLAKNRHHPVFQSEPKLYDTLAKILDVNKEPQHLKLLLLEKSIRNYIVWTRANRSVRMINKNQYSCKTTADPERQDVLLDEILKNANDIISVFKTNTAARRTDIPEEFIDMGDRESVINALEFWRKRTKTKKLLFGLQGLNDMFGGGANQGEFIGVAALSHHYKSGLLKDITRWVCVHNEPKVPEGFTPAVLMVSLENSVEGNIYDWYRALYANLYLQRPDTTKSDAEVYDAVDSLFRSKGFRLLVSRKQGETFGMAEFRELVQKLEDEGFYFVAIVIDYMQLMKVEDGGDGGASTAKAYQNLFGHMRDFANTKGITVFTGVQLNDGAAIVAGSGPYAVKRFTSQHIADSRGIYRELDTVLMQHKEADGAGRECVTWYLNKRRYVDPPPSKLRFCAYPFTELGILDDINTESKAIYDLFSVDVEEQEEVDSTTLF